jgi:hypothetical protein
MKTPLPFRIQFCSIKKQRRSPFTREGGDIQTHDYHRRLKVDEVIGGRKIQEEKIRHIVYSFFKQGKNNALKVWCQ